MADASPTSSAPSPTDARRHRVGVCSWSLKPANADDLVAALDRLQIPAVQLALSPLVDEPKVWPDAIPRLRDAGIDILSGMMAMRGEDYSTLQSIAQTGGVRSNERWPENLKHAQAVADLAAKHHISLVTFHAGFIPHVSTDHSRGTMLDRLGTIAERFNALGVGLALETGQETASTLIDALDALARPNVAVNFDPANMILYGMGDPIDSLRMLVQRVRQIHVKDALPTEQPGTWGREVVVGAGKVDWPRFFEVAKSIQPPVNFVIEREAGPSRESDIAAARDVIAQNL